jgi:hypothetical protein
LPSLTTVDDYEGMLPWNLKAQLAASDPISDRKNAVA